MSRSRLRALATCVRVVVLLAIVESMIRWVPLPRLARLLDVRLDMRPAIEPLPPNEPLVLSPRSKRQLRWTWRVAARWPFSDGPCLRRSLVAAHLLRGEGAAVRLGVPRLPGALIAHAWVEIDGRPLEDVSRYQRFEIVPAQARLT